MDDYIAYWLLKSSFSTLGTKNTTIWFPNELEYLLHVSPVRIIQ